MAESKKQLSKEECDKLVNDLALHGNSKIYDVFKKLGFNDVHSVVYEIMDYQKAIKRLNKKIIEKNNVGMIPTSFVKYAIQNIK